MTKIFYSFISKDRSREMLKYLLKKHYDYEGEIKTGANGKPYIDRQDVHFNISHSGEMVMIAFSSQPVGIDVEYVKDKDYSAVIKNFSREEQQRVNSLLDFYVLWTKKESCIKYLGQTIARIKKVNFTQNGLCYDGVAQDVNSFSERFDNYIFSVATHDSSYQKFLLI